MSLFRITYRINKDGETIELTNDIISRDSESALEKAYRTVPDSYKKMEVGFDIKEIRSI